MQYKWYSEDHIMKMSEQYLTVCFAAPLWVWRAVGTRNVAVDDKTKSVTVTNNRLVDKILDNSGPIGQQCDMFFCICLKMKNKQS